MPVVTAAWTLEAIQRASDDLFKYQDAIVLGLGTSRETRRTLIHLEDADRHANGFCKGCQHMGIEVRIVVAEGLGDDQIRLYTSKGVFLLSQPTVGYSRA